MVTLKDLVKQYDDIMEEQAFEIEVARQLVLKKYKKRLDAIKKLARQMGYTR